MSLLSYNEFKTHLRWHDYINMTIGITSNYEFNILLVRRYDWLDNESQTFIIILLGVQLYSRIIGFKTCI